MKLNPVFLWISIIIFFVTGRIRAILVRKPQNITALIEGTVRFPCSTDSSLNRIQWLYEYRGATRPSTIFNGSTVQVGYSERFLVETNGIPGRYDLIFKEIQMEDSGVFYCVEILQNKSKGQESAAHLIVYAVFKDLTVKPENTSAKIGSKVRLMCTAAINNQSVSWKHKPVGKPSEFVFYGVEGVLLNGYKSGGRHSIDRDEATGRYDLVINEINRDDAGTYTCIDEAGSGKETEAQLFVLEEEPACGGNFSKDGVLVENSCGLEPDVIMLSCRIAYCGNRAPSMTWANATDGSLIQNSTCIEIEKFKVCSIIVVASMLTNWSEYVCKVSEKITCRSENIPKNVIYVTTSTSSNSPGDISCQINSSQPCRYLLHKAKGLHNSGPIDPVQYECSAVCLIRGTECIIVRPAPVEGHSIPGPDDNYYKIVIVVVVCVTVLGIMALVSIIVIVLRMRTKAPDSKNFNKYHLTKLKSSITGLAVLNENLYVICVNKLPLVQVFKGRAPYNWLFDIVVNQMNPHDIVSWPGMNKLFVSGSGDSSDGEASVDVLIQNYRLWEIRGPIKNSHPDIISHTCFENINSLCTVSMTPLNAILMIENIPNDVNLNSSCEVFRNIEAANNYRENEPDKLSITASTPAIHMFTVPTDDEKTTCSGRHADICATNNDRLSTTASNNDGQQIQICKNNEHELSARWYIANRKGNKFCLLDVCNKKIIIYKCDQEKMENIREIKEIHLPDADIVPRLCCNDVDEIYLVATSDGWIYEIPYEDNDGGVGKYRDTDKLPLIHA